jgi:hypothetical protein
METASRVRKSGVAWAAGANEDRTAALFPCCSEQLVAVGKSLILLGWPIDKIAAIAGVGRTTVQNAMHEARRLGHITITERPRRGSKNLTNIVRISSQEWRTWSTRGPSAARLIGSNPPKMVSTTKIKDLNKKEAGNGKALIPVTRDEGTPLG